MLRFAGIGAVFLIGCGLAMPAGANGVPAPGTRVAPPAPGCNCPPVVHRRVHVRKHRPFVPPPVVVVREGPDLYNFLIPGPYDPAYDPVTVAHLDTPVFSVYE